MNIKATSNLSIVVGGHLVADEIAGCKGDKISALGGISYNLAALLAVMERGTIRPVCELGKDILDRFDETFGNSPLLDKSGIVITELPNVVNRLTYLESGDREEWNSRVPEPLSLKNVIDDTDGILLNFISGEDFRPEELERFRERFNGVVLCDYHSLALGRDNEGKRFFRKHPEWERYISIADIVQMNSLELATLSGNENLTFAGIRSFCAAIHYLGPGICIITLGRNGAVLSIEKGKSIYHIPPVTVDEEVDPTGCGDTFATLFLYDYLDSKDPLKSAILANRYAAAKVGFSGLDGFRDIKNRVPEIENTPEPVKIG